MNGHHEKAWDSLKWIRASDSPKVQAEMEEIRVGVEMEKRAKEGFRFKGRSHPCLSYSAGRALGLVSHNFHGVKTVGYVDTGCRRTLDRFCCHPSRSTFQKHQIRRVGLVNFLLQSLSRETISSLSSQRSQFLRRNNPRERRPSRTSLHNTLNS